MGSAFGPVSSLLNEVSKLEELLKELVRQVVREEMKAHEDSSAPDEFLSVKAAAEAIDVAPGTIRRWIREGRVASFGEGRFMRVRRDDLLKPRERREDGSKLSPEALAAINFGVGGKAGH